jgi:outer membrane protein OmpA-like peptidoglycan-associated protein
MRLSPPIILVTLLIAYSPIVPASQCFSAADLYFEPGVFEISAAQEKVVDRPIEEVRKTNTILAFIVVGHADSAEASEKELLELSLKRAKSVSEYVLRVHPELEGLVHIEGKGSTQPMSHTNRAANRRADIVVPCIIPADSGLPSHDR